MYVANVLSVRHACLYWAIAEQSKLSSKVKEILQNAENGFFIKLPQFHVALPNFINAVYLSGYNTLPIKDDHFKTYMDITLNEDHRDPFDRYLLAAATYENLSFITKDEKFDFYKKDLPIIW